MRPVPVYAVLQGWASLSFLALCQAQLMGGTQTLMCLVLCRMMAEGQRAAERAAADPTFFADKRNVLLGIEIDGVPLFEGSAYSMMPMLAVSLNLPPQVSVQACTRARGCDTVGQVSCCRCCTLYVVHPAVTACRTPWRHYLNMQVRFKTQNLLKVAFIDGETKPKTIQPTVRWLVRFMLLYTLQW